MVILPVFFSVIDGRVVILPVFFSVIGGRGDESGDPVGFFFCDWWERRGGW